MPSSIPRQTRWSDEWKIRQTLCVKRSRASRIPCFRKKRRACRGERNNGIHLLGISLGAIRFRRRCRAMFTVVRVIGSCRWSGRNGCGCCCLPGLLILRGTPRQAMEVPACLRSAGRVEGVFLLDAYQFWFSIQFIRRDWLPTSGSAALERSRSHRYREDCYFFVRSGMLAPWF